MVAWSAQPGRSRGSASREAHGNVRGIETVDDLARQLRVARPGVLIGVSELDERAAERLVGVDEKRVTRERCVRGDEDDRLRPVGCESARSNSQRLQRCVGRVSPVATDSGDEDRRMRRDDSERSRRHERVHFLAEFRELQLRPRATTLYPAVYPLGTRSVLRSTSTSSIWPANSAPVAPRRYRDVDHLVRRRATGERVLVPLADSLEEHRLYRSYDAAVVAERRGMNELDESVEAGLGDLTRNAVRQRRGRSALPRRVDEGERLVEPDLPDDVDRVVEVGLRLTGETDDHVG